MTTKTRPLEDNYEDILNKALRGLQITPASLATQTGLSPSAINGLLSGRFNEEGARLAAGALGLDADRLVSIGRKEYEPAEIELMPGFSEFTTVFEDMTVNSYLIWDPDSKKAAAFDTGSDVSGMLEAIEKHGLKLELILLTHTHGDHIFDLDRLREKTGALAWVAEGEAFEGATAFKPGKKFQVGKLDIETRLTWGHAKAGITYVVHGLPRLLAIVGDAIFAGSMGGGMVSYKDALETNRREILSLPEDTVLCPGHGPLTTVLEQKRNNPFFPEA